MHDKKFDPKKLKKLNNPERLKDIPPAYVQDKLRTAKHPQICVEIGAGTAFFSVAFLEQFKSSTMYACDLSATMLDWITENIVPDHPAVIPLKNEEQTLPLEDEIADLVFMIALHHELDNPLEMLKECKRILKPGGEIFIIDWKKEEMDQGPPQEIRCKPERIKEQLTESGFIHVRLYDNLKKHFLLLAGKENVE